MDILDDATTTSLLSDDYAEVEGTHSVFDHHGHDPYSTPLDTLFGNEAMGFAMAGAMEQEVGG